MVVVAEFVFKISHDSAIHSSEMVEGVTQIFFKAFLYFECFRGYTDLRGIFVNQDQFEFAFVDPVKNKLPICCFVVPLLSGFELDIAYAIIDFALSQDSYVLLHCETLSIEWILRKRLKTEDFVFMVLQIATVALVP